MTRVDVGGTGYDDATEALISVNQLSALHYESLTSDLAGYGGMAGDDSTSHDFATQYDPGAQGAVDALRDFVDAAGNLGVLTALSIENHRKADNGAVYGAPPLVYDGSQSLSGAGEVDVPAFTVPSSEGGDAGGAPEFWDLVVDHLEGFVWPNADTGKLRRAATTWRTAQRSVAVLPDTCDTAIGLLNAQKSPEIPLAVNAVTELKDAAVDLAEAFGDLASACDGYADVVDQQREVIKGILKELAIELGITATIGVITSFFTFGGGGAVAAGVATARAIKFAKRIIKAIDDIRDLAKARALLALGRVGTKVKGLGPVLRRLATKSRNSFKGFKGPKKPPNAKEIADIGKKVSRQKQARHVKDTPEWVKRGKGGYFNSEKDAQDVLDALHSGKAKIVGYDKHGHPIVRHNDVTGYNNNPAAGYVDQPTHVFIIKGTSPPSVVPTSPTKG